MSCVPLKAISFLDARARIRRFAMFHFAITYGNYGAPALTPTAQIIQTASSQYNSHRFPASAFLQVAVSEAPAHSISRPQIFASERFRFSPKTSRPSGFAPTGLTPRQMRIHMGVSRVPILFWPTGPRGVSTAGALIVPNRGLVVV